MALVAMAAWRGKKGAAMKWQISAYQ